MIPAAILNAILALGVIVIALTPLVWTILTQHARHSRPEATDGTAGHWPRRQAPRRAPQPGRNPIIERVHVRCLAPATAANRFQREPES